VVELSAYASASWRAPRGAFAIMRANDARQVWLESACEVAIVGAGQTPVNAALVRAAGWCRRSDCGSADAGVDPAGRRAVHRQHDVGHAR
jgi:hypothetical protein